MGARDHMRQGGGLDVALAVLVAAASAGAALAMLGVELVSPGAPRDALAADLDTAVGLLVHNARVVTWPLALIALAWHRTRGLRALGDTLVLAQLLGHGAIVGSALAQHPTLWRYLPHLPLEWLAIAAPATAWLRARQCPQRHGGAWLVRPLVGVLALLALAAIVETYAIPL